MEGSNVIKRSHSFPIGPTAVGAIAWRDSTMRGVKDNNKLIARSDTTVTFGRAVDPIPFLRDVFAEMSNTEAIHYWRKTRLILHKLRESIVDTNEEMKSLNRVREALEQMHEHMRKDVKTNDRCRETRMTRPPRERCNDAADDLLVTEHVHLDNILKLLETHLKLVKSQLQTLSDARERLTAVCQERARALDLICDAVPTVGRQNLYVRMHNLAPAAKKCRDFHDPSDDPPRCTDKNVFPVEPFGPFTNECDVSLEDGHLARNHSATLRDQAEVLLGRVDGIQKSAHETVRRSLMQKIFESKNLKAHLDIAIGENSYANNHAQRYYDKTEHAYFQTQGPESYHDLRTHEKLNRPIIKTFQRHTNTNLPESQEVIRAGDELLSAAVITGRNIAVLKLQRMKLIQDAEDKQKAIRIDDSVCKLRSRRFPHRWVIGGVREHSWF